MFRIKSFGVSLLGSKQMKEPKLIQAMVFSPELFIVFLISMTLYDLCAAKFTGLFP